MSNSLINERSPYLRQHAENPVNWYPWCSEAFDRAKREDRPVFLSIGYSTCHWCHVMAEESFSDGEVAALLNRDYISVKVDREERPDIDTVYMSACTALNGSGGWPLTVIMTPEQQPFFVGTYIPKRSRDGKIGLIELLSAVAGKWKNDRTELLKAAGELTEYLRGESAGSEASAAAMPEAAAAQLMASYDSEYGGFGTAPKFPSAHNLIFLMQQSKLGGDRTLRQAVENTLRQMYRGGIYDHFGGGFCRYSTDREWLLPHFEKTLYDNALLALCYTEAWQDGHMALYRTVAEDTLDYCLRELKAERGGFYCAQDADSGGTEGAYYLFDGDEVKKLLGEDAGRHFCECYDITPEGNFGGRSIPNLLLNNRWSFLPEGYDEYRERLRIYRGERMELMRDTKLLTAWNALMLAAMSRAAFAFNDRRYLAEAEELEGFMRESFFKDGKLMARLCEGELRFDAELEDYAFYALALLELYRADFDAEHIALALTLAEAAAEHFADPRGGYFRTADCAEKLIVRPKEVFDGALPSGNSALAVLFDRLFAVTGDMRWRDRGDRQLKYLASVSERYPAGCCTAWTAQAIRNHGTREAVFVLPDEAVPESVRAVISRYAPELTVLIKTTGNAPALAGVAPYTGDMKPLYGKAALYICTDGVCSAPLEL